MAHQVKIFNKDGGLVGIITEEELERRSDKMVNAPENGFSSVQERTFLCKQCGKLGITKQKQKNFCNPDCHDAWKKIKAKELRDKRREKKNKLKESL